MQVQSWNRNEIIPSPFPYACPCRSMAGVVNGGGKLGASVVGETRFFFGTMPTKYTFTGQYSYTDDPSTQGVTEGFGLMFFNARWMDPSLGRFAQPDTIVPTQTQGTQAWDRYAFVNNNPVRYNDPTGHQIKEDKGGQKGHYSDEDPPEDQCELDDPSCYLVDSSVANDLEKQMGTVQTYLTIGGALLAGVGGLVLGLLLAPIIGGVALTLGTGLLIAGVAGAMLLGIEMLIDANQAGAASTFFSNAGTFSGTNSSKILQINKSVGVFGTTYSYEAENGATDSFDATLPYTNTYMNLYTGK